MALSFYTAQLWSVVAAMKYHFLELWTLDSGGLAVSSATIRKSSDIIWCHM